ncbi:response regulator [Nocardioides marmoribigeumensis]|jgi:DNA-binding NarL/FixJ family response regulator|uniref:DNA-binding NarL/FixJ family response regulator n=1 Tax=Nocardioides marmoribigeumensis TaxID=433649 RepID=A0ABU2C0J7_9ACTN|nr:response regulator transcription factor [Nocardioides marmoribigeumensis]MDR7364167.1 DNA-binding NarL/FixJ family response regulator [Nocardioides marmoribigeumensis]
MTATPAVPSTPTVLIVDDDPAVRDVVRATLEHQGFEIVGEAVDGLDAVEQFVALDPPPSAVVLDERMPGTTGLETAVRMLAHRPNQVVVLFSAALNPGVVEAALNVGILQCVDKLEVRRLPRVLHVLLGG